MSDLWQRIQNIKKELKFIKKLLLNNYPWGYCCLTIKKKGNKTTFKCSRYELPEKQFKVKCEACKEEINQFLQRLNT